MSKVIEINNKNDYDEIPNKCSVTLTLECEVYALNEDEAAEIVQDNYSFSDAEKDVFCIEDNSYEEYLCRKADNEWADRF